MLGQLLAQEHRYIKGGAALRGHNALHIKGGAVLTSQAALYVKGGALLATQAAQYLKGGALFSDASFPSLYLKGGALLAADAARYLTGGARFAGEAIYIGGGARLVTGSPFEDLPDNPPATKVGLLSRTWLSLAAVKKDVT